MGRLSRVAASAIAVQVLVGGVWLLTSSDDLKLWGQPTRGCHSNFVYGLAVRTRSAETGEQAGNLATITILDSDRSPASFPGQSPAVERFKLDWHSYRNQEVNKASIDILSPERKREAIDSYLTAHGAGERPGAYRVVVEKAGYARWERDNIEVKSDGCHPIPRVVTARLVPEAS